MSLIVSNNKAWGYGDTLDLYLQPKPSPFTDDSMSAFIDSFKSNEETNKNHGNDGQFSLSFTLCKDNKEVCEALGVRGRLQVTYGPVGGDAELAFAKENANGTFDSSLIVKAIHKGRVIKTELQERNKLQLRANILKQIQPNNSGQISYTFDDFTNDYGSYLIIGYEYGGKIIHNTTFKTRSMKDKISFNGKLSVQYVYL
eukprot:UN13695